MFKYTDFQIFKAKILAIAFKAKLYDVRFTQIHFHAPLINYRNGYPAVLKEFFVYAVLCAI